MERLNLLHKGAEVLRKSDESAFTIVPSHMSSRLPSIYSNSSRISIESAKLVYRQLTVDNDLFTARVYKRNYRHPSMNFPMKRRTSTSLQTRERPSPGVVATETLDHQIQPASLGNQSMISLDREEESTSQPPYSTRATLLKTFDRVQIPSSLWFSGLPTSTHGRHTVVGPAVSIDLVYVYMDHDPEQSRDLAESVFRCRRENLVHLLQLLARGFPTWRNRYLGEACNQEKVDLVQLLLDNDQGLREKLMPRSQARWGDDLRRKRLNEVALQLLLTERGKNALSNAVTRVQLDITLSEHRRQDAEWRFSYGLPAEHCLLLAASHKRDWDSVEALLNHGVDINAKFEDGKTCLLKMASCSHSPFKGINTIISVPYMRALVNLGADIKATTQEGDNFLHLIARYKYSWLVMQWHYLGISDRELFSALSAVNQEGLTPALVAEQAGNEQFLAFLDDVIETKIFWDSNLDGDPGISELEAQKDETAQN